MERVNVSIKFQNWNLMYTRLTLMQKCFFDIGKSICFGSRMRLLFMIFLLSCVLLTLLCCCSDRENHGWNRVEWNRTKYISKIISSYVCFVFVVLDVSFPHLACRVFYFSESLLEKTILRRIWYHFEFKRIVAPYLTSHIEFCRIKFSVNGISKSLFAPIFKFFEYLTQLCCNIITVGANMHRGVDMNI